MKNRGKFIGFEGLDGAGKTTLAKLLEDQLSGKVKIIKHPPKEMYDYIENVRKGDRKSLSLKEELDFVKNIKVKEQQEILKELENGTTIIADRTIFTSYLHHMDRDVNPKVIYNLVKDILIPDLVLYIKVPIKVSIKRQLKRARNDVILFPEKLKIENIKKSKQNYDKLAKKFGFKVVYNTTNIQKTLKQCIKYIDNVKVDETCKTVEEYLVENMRTGKNELLSKVCTGISDYYILDNQKDIL